jgi:hypothetical protein
MEETAGKYNKSHCEERSDAAIFVILFWIVDYHAFDRPIPYSSSPLAGED